MALTETERDTGNVFSGLASMKMNTRIMHASMKKELGRRHLATRLASTNSLNTWPAYCFGKEKKEPINVKSQNIKLLNKRFRYTPSEKTMQEKYTNFLQICDNRH